MKDNDYLSYLMNINGDDKKQNGKNEYQIERDDNALTFKSRLDLSWEERNELGELYDEVKPEFGRSMNYSGYYWKEEYAYDNASNIDYRLDGYGKIDFTTDAANHLIGKGELSYSYDANGNLKEETLGTKTRSYGYSLDNRPVSVETVNPQAIHPGTELPRASYGYDALGRRVLSETVNPPNPGYGNLETEREVYRYDGRGFNIAEVYNMVDPLRGRSDKTERYEYQYVGRSLLSVEEIQENQRYRHQNSSDNNVTRYFQDVLGSTITTVTGNKKENYTYSVFGSNMESDLEDAYMVGYNGKREDEVTGFYNYGFRDYSPQMMRFTTEDPIRDGLNWYVYVNNDPVNKIDLWGLEAGDTFLTQNAAARDWANTYFDDTTKQGKEFASFIYTEGESYSYTVPKRGSRTSVGPGKPPENATAIIHSHPDDNRSEEGEMRFSYYDISNANSDKIDAYLLDKEGGLQVWEYGEPFDERFEDYVSNPDGSLFTASGNDVSDSYYTQALFWRVYHSEDTANQTNDGLKNK